MLGALFLILILSAGLVLLTVRRGWRGAVADIGISPTPSEDASNPWSPLDLFTGAALVGTAVTTIVGLVLAHAGVFSAGAVALTVAVVVAGIGFTRRGTRIVFPAIRRPSLPEGLACVLAAGVLIYGVGFRFHEVAGLRDPGVYINTGIELSRTGTLGWIDPVIDRYGFFVTEHLIEDVGLKIDERPRWLRFAGYYLTHPERGVVKPQFLHGYEVWVALAYSFGGVQATQILNSAFAALALLAFFGAFRMVSGSGLAAGFAILLLAVNPAQLWYARWPGNEMMIQALLWGFLFLYARALQTPESGGAQREVAQRRLVVGALLLIGTAALVKIAAWLLLPAVAFDLGYQRARGLVRMRGRNLWLMLVLLALVAFLHALLFAPFYYYGSWKFTAGVRGVSFLLFPILFVGGTAAAFSLGNLAAPALAAMGRRTREGRSGPAMAAVALVVLIVSWIWQERRLKVGISARDVWSDATNLAEFVFYFGPLPFVAGALGLALLAVRRPTPGGSIFLLLLLGSSTLLIQRNLDAFHPWGARRWLVFLIPAFSAGMGYLLTLIWRGRPAGLRRGVAVAGLAVCVGFLLTAAPQLITTRNFYGVVAGLDRLANHMRPDDLILTQPSGNIMRWAPYLKARFDIDLYKHPFTEQAWANTRPLLQSAAEEGRRVLFIADAPLTQTIALEQGLVPIHEEFLAFTELTDGLRRIESAPVTITQTLDLYQIRADALPRGWWPGADDALQPRPEGKSLPMELSMGEEAEPYIENFFGVTEPVPGMAFRWSNGSGRIYLGELLKLPLPPGRGPLRLTARLSSGREELKEPLHITWYLDLAVRGRQRELAVTPVGSDWTTVTVELDPALIRPDSYLELKSPRPPVGNIHPGGYLGHLLMSLRIE